MGLIPGLGDPLEKEMATHFSKLARKIPWTGTFPYGEADVSSIPESRRSPGKGNGNPL